MRAALEIMSEYRLSFESHAGGSAAFISLAMTLSRHSMFFVQHEWPAAFTEHLEVSLQDQPGRPAPSDRQMIVSAVLSMIVMSSQIPHYAGHLENKGELPPEKVHTNVTFRSK
jgi:hypothetical protein